MVISAAANGSTTSANTVQASQVFSQAHLRAYFIGIVKLAFMTPAMIRVAIPLAVLLMTVFLPLSFGWSGMKPVLFFRQIDRRKFQGGAQKCSRQILGL